MIQKNEIKRGQKNPTTNYPKDTHSAFCKRCYEHNGGCPNTRSKVKDSACAL